MAERLAVDVADSVADRVTTQVADLLASGLVVGPRRYPRERNTENRQDLIRC
jgi:hypothetical protein